MGWKGFGGELERERRQREGEMERGQLEPFLRREERAKKKAITYGTTILINGYEMMIQVLDRPR